MIINKEGKNHLYDGRFLKTHDLFPQTADPQLANTLTTQDVS